RHQAAAQLVDGGFPDLGFLADLAQVEGVDGEASSPVFGVVAADAVVVDQPGKRFLATGMGSRLLPQGEAWYNRQTEQRKPACQPDGGSGKRPAIAHQYPQPRSRGFSWSHEPAAQPS